MRRLSLIVLSLALVSCGAASSAPDPPALTKCGKARWAVKTLSDPAAASVKFGSPQTMTIGDLVNLTPTHVTGNTERLPGVEMTVYRVQASLKEMTEEHDLDIHLVIVDDVGQTMIAEFPSTDCQGMEKSIRRTEIANARQAFTQACGAEPHEKTFTQLSGKATLTGIGFFDEKHAEPQHGVAKNEIELHPVIQVEDVQCKVTGTNHGKPMPRD